MNYFFQRLNTRLALTAAVCLFILLIAALFYIYEVYSGTTNKLQANLTDDISSIYINAQQRQLADIATFLGAELFEAVAIKDIADLNGEIQQALLLTHAKSILVTDNKGVVLSDGTAENQKAGLQLFFPRELVEKHLIVSESADGYQQVFFVINKGLELAGYGVITFTQQQRFTLLKALNQNIETTLVQFRNGFGEFAWISIVFVFGCCFGLAIWLYKSLSVPILKMIEAAEEYSIGNYNHAISVRKRSTSEVGRLAAALNKMAVNIQEAEEKIIYQAHFDNLTGLPNRFLILDRLNHSISEANRDESGIAVCFLDLDGFKKVNDTLGHDAGDKLLLQAAERISGAVRSVDSVGRLGGDEFIVLLKGLSQSDDAMSSAEAILRAFAIPFQINERELTVTTSIGIAIYPENGDHASDLLRSADAAMYHAKAKGKNTYAYFSNEMNAKLSRQLSLEEKLRGALERNEFQLLYQPKIDVATNQMVGAEALLRWYNDELGNVSPEEFIPVLEQTTMIVDVGRYVLEQAIKKAKQWRQEYVTDFVMAINISPRQIRLCDLPDLVASLLAEHHTSADAIELEITEGVLMETHLSIKKVFSQLSDMGVKLAMDDFGKGYSSLSYLRNFPFDVVKIDRSFVNDISDDPQDRELIAAAIAMAHGLSLKVVAEGVETQPQLTFLQQNNCDFAQGYLFSKPITATEMTALLRKQSEQASSPFSHMVYVN
jgi:diguanylate cyclase (GGDEF)-like protein